MAEIPVEVWQVVRDKDGQDVMFLRDARGRLLLIYIGTCEAAAIWVRLLPELAAPYIRRPWSHDLVVTMLERLHASLQRVVIDNVANGTFYATLYIQHGERDLVLDARPSDAIALALRMAAPLAVEESVMDEAAIELQQDGEEPGEDDELGRWS